MRGHIAGVVAVEPEHGSDCDHVADYEEGPTASDDECEYNVKRVAPMPVKDVSIKATFMALVQFFETVTLETLPPVRPNEARLPDEICELVLHHVSDTKTYNACLKVSRRFRLICQKSPLVMDDIVFQDLLPTYQAFSSSQENEDKKVTPGPQVPPDFLAVELSSGQQKSVWLEWGDSRTDALTCFVVAGNEWNRKTFIRQSITLQGLCSPLAGACETGKRTPMPRHRKCEMYGSEGTNWELPILSSRINIESTTREIGHLWKEALRRFDFPMNEPGPGWSLPPNTVHYFGTAMSFDEDDERPFEYLFFHYLYLRVKRLGKFCDNQWEDIIREATEELNQTKTEDLKPCPHGGVIGGDEPFVILAVGLEARLFQWHQGFDETVDEEARRKRSLSSALRELNPGTVLNVCEKSDREEIERFLKRVQEHKNIITARKSETFEGRLKWY